MNKIWQNVNLSMRLQYVSFDFKYLTTKSIVCLEQKSNNNQNENQIFENEKLYSSLRYKEKPESNKSLTSTFLIKGFILICKDFQFFNFNFKIDLITFLLRYSRNGHVTEK